MWGADGKEHTGGPGAINNKNHKLESEGNTKFRTLILSTNQPTDKQKLGSCMGNRWKRLRRRTRSNPEKGS